MRDSSRRGKLFGLRNQGCRLTSYVVLYSCDRNDVSTGTRCWSRDQYSEFDGQEGYVLWEENRISGNGE